MSKRKELPKVVKFGEFPKEGIYSEQWLVFYEIEKEGTYFKNHITYCTESKGMSSDVESQFHKDYPKGKLIKIKYL